MKKDLVFGLDIGTRSVVGTVGYRQGDKFIVVAQRVKEHDTRAMLDGQIHDIQKVGETIREVKLKLEEAIQDKLEHVCIAAAGRVLFTVNSTVSIDLDNREVVQEDIHNLVSAGVEKAYEDFLKNNKTDDGVKFYCVGHSVVRFYLNGTQISNLEGHKARNISADIIATFLPDDVVDSLYKAVEIAGLSVANLTLEPIAAIQLAIPERFRMLNLALVDVGAGTSDISITNDGCILAFGMIPIAGDALTEDIAKTCLVEFSEAERIKKEADYKDEVEYFDIMLLPQKITSKEVQKATSKTIESMATQVAEKIIELNGGKSVSACFIVGGGGKMPGYAEAVAKKLGIAKERVALRGEEVMQNIVFNEDIKKDSLLVTPIGICLNYYEQSNNFIFVSFNGSRIKMYDNNNLTVGDAAIQVQFPNDGLFPKRGDSLEFKVNGKKRSVRGLPGEAACIFVNEQLSTITTKIHSNDVIRVIESTKGESGKATLENVKEMHDSINVIVNGNEVSFPKVATVNGELKSSFYDIKKGDDIRILPYYTVSQILEFMDIAVDINSNIYVNNALSDRDTKVYDNYTLDWKENIKDNSKDIIKDDEKEEIKEIKEIKEAVSENEEIAEQIHDIYVIVNGFAVTLKNKSNYVFVDVFDYINFDLSKPNGRTVVTKLNGRPAQYMENLKNGDTVEIYWQEK